MDHTRMIDVVQANMGKKVGLVLVSGRFVSGIVTDIHAGLIRLSDDDDKPDDGTASYVKEEFVMALEEESAAETRERAAKLEARRPVAAVGGTAPDHASDAAPAELGNPSFVERGYDPRAGLEPGPDGRITAPNLPARAGDPDFQGHVSGVAKQEIGTGLTTQDATARRQAVERNLVTHDEERTEHPVTAASAGARDVGSEMTPGDPRRVIIPDEPGLKADHPDGSTPPQSAHLGAAPGFDDSDNAAAAAEHQHDAKHE